MKKNIIRKILRVVLLEGGAAFPKNWVGRVQQRKKKIKEIKNKTKVQIKYKQRIVNNLSISLVLI